MERLGLLLAALIVIALCVAGWGCWLATDSDKDDASTGRTMTAVGLAVVAVCVGCALLLAS